MAKVTPAALLTLNERGVGFQLVGRMKREREGGRVRVGKVGGGGGGGGARRV